MQRLPIIQIQRDGYRDFRRHRPQTYRQPRLSQHAGQRGHILQIELITRMVLRDEQHIARIRAVFFDGRLNRLNTQRVKRRIQVIKAAGKQIGIHRGQLVTGVTQID